MLFHDELNPAIWQIDNDNKIIPEVETKLKEIASAFIEYLEIPQDSILDMVITGSSASYNYNKYSDLDLHIIVDYDKIHEDCPLVEGYLGALKNTFNKEHDITIHGVPVELYAEKKDQGTVHNGLYSLLQGKWIDFPQKIQPTDNDAAVEAKYNEIKEMVEKCDDSEQADELLDKIYKMRKAGLATAGEFGTENLAFKKLRNEGCMDKLRELKKEHIDKQLSLESFEGDIKQFCVVKTGGSIGEKDRIVDCFDTKEEAQEAVKRYRKRLSPSERKYYGIKYTVIDKDKPGKFANLFTQEIKEENSNDMFENAEEDGVFDNTIKYTSPLEFNQKLEQARKNYDVKSQIDNGNLVHLVYDNDKHIATFNNNTKEFFYDEPLELQGVISKGINNVDKLKELYNEEKEMGKSEILVDTDYGVKAIMLIDNPNEEYKYVIVDQDDEAMAWGDDKIDVLDEYIAYLKRENEDTDCIEDLLANPENIKNEYVKEQLQKYMEEEEGSLEVSESCKKQISIEEWQKLSKEDQKKYVRNQWNPKKYDLKESNEVIDKPKRRKINIVNLLDWFVGPDVDISDYHVDGDNLVVEYSEDGETTEKMVISKDRMENELGVTDLKFKNDENGSLDRISFIRITESKEEKKMNESTHTDQEINKALLGESLKEEYLYDNNGELTGYTKDDLFAGCEVILDNGEIVTIFDKSQNGYFVERDDDSRPFEITPDRIKYINYIEGESELDEDVATLTAKVDNAEKDLKDIMQKLSTTQLKEDLDQLIGQAVDGLNEEFEDGPIEDNLEEIKQVLAAYADTENAFEDGYVTIGDLRQFDADHWLLDQFKDEDFIQAAKEEGYEVDGDKILDPSI